MCAWKNMNIFVYLRNGENVCVVDGENVCVCILVKEKEKEPTNV